jgi:hypothetical protein
LKALRKAAADARRAAERASRELQVAKERRDRAAGVLNDAAAALIAARDRAEEAVRAEREARQALD